MVRPLLIGDEVIIEPRKCDLYTGAIRTRTHPVTGEMVPWEFYRPGHTCAATSATENCLFYRSYNAAYYDLKEDKGLSYYGAIRPGCWINMIPGNGLVLFPEASSGCTCSFPLRTSVVLKPEANEEVEDWSLYISNAPLTPVRHLAINLGAPGDKKDKNGTIWFGYPRPETQTGLKFEIKEDIPEGMGYYSYDSKGVQIEGTDYPWLHTNGCVGLRKCEITLINDLFGEREGTYTVRLGFVAPANRRKFDISIQGRVVNENLDVLKETGGVNRALVKEFKGIPVQNLLSLELIPENPSPELSQAPVINFIEIIREDLPAGAEVSGPSKWLTAKESENLLAQASTELDNRDFSGALDKYHRVLNNAASKQSSIKALQGMEAIASTASLPEIKKYCQRLDPVMWDYKEPDQEIVDAAVKVHLSIAGKVKEKDAELAKRMLGTSILLTHNPAIRESAGSALADLGVTMYADIDSSLNGLTYDYYEGEWLQLPDFDLLSPQKSGKVYNFSLEEIETRQDHFAICFTGFMYVPLEGKYTFYLKSDDGSNLYIGQKLVVDNDGSHDVKEKNGTIILKEGEYPIKLEYFEDYAGQMLEVYFKGPGIEKQPIPGRLLSIAPGNSE
jgi:hypothetical protein